MQRYLFPENETVTLLFLQSGYCFLYVKPGFIKLRVRFTKAKPEESFK